MNTTGNPASGSAAHTTSEAASQPAENLGADSGPFTVLITGATRGIGRQTARLLASRGHRVWLGARDGHRGHVVAQEICRDLTGRSDAQPAGGPGRQLDSQVDGQVDSGLPSDLVRVVPLDVTDDRSVAAAAAAISAQGVLDVVVNNAAVLGPMDLAGTTSAQAAGVFDTNVVGVLRVTNTFLPLLTGSSAPAVINVSSSLGSPTRAADPHDVYAGYPLDVYRASKAAVNLLTIQYSKANPGIRFVAVDPDLTATDMTGGQGQEPALAAIVVSRKR